MNILFVTWDGPQVHYLEGLFIPILRELSAGGHKVHVLQFQWGNAEWRARIRKVCEEAGCSYQAIQVWRRPIGLGSFATALLSVRAIRRVIRKLAIDVLMPRSTLPAFACCLAAKTSPRIRIIFDADGLPHDERVEHGGWSVKGMAYRVLRDLEAAAVQRADTVLVRTHVAREILRARAGPGVSLGKFSVVTNGRDPSLFRIPSVEESRATRRSLGVEDRVPLVCYVGSLGSQYCIPEMIDVCAAILELMPEARFLVLTSTPQIMFEALQHASSVRECAIVMSVSHREVAAYIGASDLGLALRAPTFSMQAVAPIKVGEYLLCGVPVLASSGLAATDELEKAEVGLCVSLDSRGARRAAHWFRDSVLPSRDRMRERCRRLGLDKYSIRQSVVAYGRALGVLREAPV